MSDIEQIKQKLHELEVKQATLDQQLVLFDDLADDHESLKVRNLRKLRRVKAVLSKFEAKNG